MAVVLISLATALAAAVVARTLVAHLDLPDDAAPALPMAVLAATSAALLATCRAGDRALPVLLWFVAAGCVLAGVDTAVHRLPDLLTVGALPGVGVLMAVAAATGSRPIALVGAAVGGSAANRAFIGLRGLSARLGPPMGRGDVKLAALLGTVLGWYGVQAWCVGLAAGLFASGCAGAAVLLRRRAPPGTAVPLGPGLLLGTFVALLIA
jgi:leader peptidase (prepilin peptidase)/N-methyltransferase